MNIQEIDIHQLLPYEFNAVKHSDKQVNMIANSIREFGFTIPIIVGANNSIIAGHGRIAAAKKLGLEKVPAILRDDLTPAQEKAFRILDNKLTKDSDWDIDNLKIEFEQLEDLGFDLEGFGLNDLNIWDEKDAGEDSFSYDPNIEIKTGIKEGDLIELDEHRVLCGDSTKGEDVAKAILEMPPFIMVTDPPYGVEYDASWRTKVKTQKGITQLGVVTADNRADWEEAFKLFTGNVIYCWHGGKHAAQVARNLENADFEIRNQIIWKKQKIVFGRGSYHWQHEPCWYAVRKGEKSHWCGDRKQSTIWEMKNNNPFGGEKEEKMGHSTQKPIECMARPLRNHGKDGDVVYDPFLGSGTTLIAADKLKRRCIGIEINPVYCQVVVNRYEKYCKENGRNPIIRINGSPA